MKKAFKWIGIVLLSPILLFIILTVLLYVPPIQNWVAQKVASYASEQTGMQITVGHVDLDFPLDLGIDNVRIIKDTDTIADIERAVVDVELWPLLSSKVVLKQLELSQAKLNTINFIDDIRFKGTLGRLAFSAPEIDLKCETMQLRDLLLSESDLTVYMSDTAAVDTSTQGWHIMFNEVKLQRSHLNIVIDSTALFQEPQTHIGTYMEHATISDGDVDLGLAKFRFGAIDWQDGQLSYNDAFALTSLNLGLDSLYSYGDDLRLAISHGSTKETSTGMELTQLQGLVAMDGEGIHISGLQAHTPHSAVAVSADMDYTALDAQSTGRMMVDINASVGRQDLMLLDTGLPIAHWPEEPLTINGKIDGNMTTANIERLTVTLPTVLHAEASGQLHNLMDTDRLLAQLNIKAETYNTALLTHVIDLPPTVSIPSGVSISATVDADGPHYAANLTARHNGGTATVKGSFNQQAMSYDAIVSVNNMNMRHFMPQDSIGIVTADIALSGQGTDIFSPDSHVEADAHISRLQYGSWALDSIQAKASLNDGHALVSVTGYNKLMDGNIDIDAILGRQTITAGINADMRRLDLHALNISDDPLVTGLCGHFDVTSDMDMTHTVSGLISDIYLRDSIATHHPEEVGILLKTSPDTTCVRLQSGNLIVKLDAQGNYEQLFSRLEAVGDSIATQLNNRVIDQAAIRQTLPTMRLYMSSGRNNPLADILKTSANISYKDMLADITTSPTDGINGHAFIHALNIDSTRIDTIALRLVHKDKGLTFNGQVTNNRRNPGMVFNAVFDGLLQEHGASIGARLFDSQGQMGLRLGAKAEMEADGIRFHLMPQRPTLGYKEFTLNDDNFLLLGNDLKLQAKVDLIADDGTGIKVYSEDQNSTLLQDLTVSVHKLNLQQLTAAMPFLPRISGMLNGDYHLTMNHQHQISIASDMQITAMTYEDNPMGNISTEFVYLQRENDTHAVEAILMRDNKEIGNFRGSYQDYGSGRLDATLTLTHMPLDIINGFIPDKLFGFEGYTEGEISIKGSLSRPQANGEIYLDSAFLVSRPYGVRLRFDNDPVRIIDSKLLLENFTMYAHNDNPLNIMGNIDFHDTDNMTINMRMRAQNFQLINSKQRRESIAYGKMFVNFYAIMSGSFSRLKMQGRLDILGTTDLNYILLDSPLSTDNQMEELVKFTDFTDSTQTVVERPTPDGLDVNMSITIDQGAHVKCDLNAEQTNYVDLYGGGDLNMRYNADGINLTGRYTLTNGTMKYSLPVIPLKTFTIKEGSYVEFTGDPANPRLNLSATERKKATVGTEDGQSRSVTFDCGVVITKTLADMGVEFIIDAPEDITVSSELNAMGTEQRAKLAVTMLTTGMYLADGNTNSFSMNSALSSFLQSEINNITGNALKTLDLSIGLDNATDATGQMHTDYSFRFAKRFWNNRLKVQIGGKLSTGAEMQGQNQSFFDNVTMEYRLSPTSNQYVKLFYNQNVYDWLEGYTGEYGGGYVWRRKLNSLIDLFKTDSETNTLQRARIARPTIRTAGTDSIPAPANNTGIVRPQAATEPTDSTKQTVNE